jgi:hypothetical protein
MNEWSAPLPPIRSTWIGEKLLIKGPLTDKKIEEYRERGWYSVEFREARRALLAKRAARREGKRTGNFIEVGGRLIYSP